MVTFAGARLVRAMEEQEAQLAAGQRSVVTITPAVIFALTEQYRSCLNLLAVGGRSDLVRSSAEVTCLSVIEQYYVSP